MNEAEKQARREEIIREIATGIAEVIEENFGENMGFIFVLFEFRKKGFTNYISNADREDVIRAMRDTADILEKKEDMPVAHRTVQ